MCDRSDEQDAAMTTDTNDVNPDAELIRRHHLDNYLSVDCDKPLNLEMNKNNIRSSQTPLSNHHSTPTYTAGLQHLSFYTPLYA